MNRKILSAFLNNTHRNRSLEFINGQFISMRQRVALLSSARPKASIHTHGPCCNTTKMLGCCNNYKLNRISETYILSSAAIQFISHRNFCMVNSTERTCWSCKRKIGHEKFFCKRCKIIQPPLTEMSFFEIFDSEETFDVETKLLTDSYRRLQSILHPDKFGSSNDEEQQYSAEQSSLINKAYNTILDPLSRAVYMLELRDIYIKEGNTSQDSDFLMEIMEINEMLSEVTSLEHLDKIQQKNKVSIEECIKEIAASFSRGDNESAKESVIKLRYFRNILEVVKRKTLELD